MNFIPQNTIVRFSVADVHFGLILATQIFKPTTENVLQTFMCEVFPIFFCQFFLNKIETWFKVKKFYQQKLFFICFFGDLFTPSNLI